MKDLIDHFTEWRTELNETQAQYADRFGMSQSMVSLIEDRKAQFGKANLAKILDIRQDWKDAVIRYMLANPEVARQNV